MSTAEIEIRQPRPQANAAALPAKIAYARELANSGLLPAAYRRQPGNILYAVEYGEMLGLAPMAAITGVHVIEGKPTASAGLISALVRRAGHKLRVTGDGTKATCQIVRADDPDFTFEVTWTLKRDNSNNPSAEAAGLLGKSVWKQYPASMLKSRAITQCARDACEEALFGLHYTPEELGAEVDEDGAVVGGTVVDEGSQQQAPADDPWYVRPSPEQEWLAKAIEAAPGRDLNGCKEDWQASVKHVHDGKLTKGEAGRLQDILRPRIKALMDAQAASGPADGEVAEAEVVEEGNGAALGAEDPWAVAISEAVDAGQAERILADARDQAGRSELDAARLALIEQAIEEAFPGLTATEARAA